MTKLPKDTDLSRINIDELMEKIEFLMQSRFGQWEETYIIPLEGSQGRISRTVLRNSARLDQLEAESRDKKRDEKEKSRSTTRENGEKILQDLKLLEQGISDSSIILFYIMELESDLGNLESKARGLNRKYEARLAGSLRDICRLYEPSRFTEKQLRTFCASIRALIDGWGDLTREKVNWIRSRLLDVELTWIPVTQRAEEEISEIEKTFIEKE